MPLPPPRSGEHLDFQIYPFVTENVTLGDPEKIIWSSIKLLTGHDIVDRLLFDSHGKQ
jgi:hypothetical protein